MVHGNHGVKFQDAPSPHVKDQAQILSNDEVDEPDEDHHILSNKRTDFTVVSGQRGFIALTSHFRTQIQQVFLPSGKAP